MVSYYRLSAYTLPFQCGNPEHHFNHGASFCKVLDLYIFDRQLRLLLLDAIERIEVALRARMTNALAKNHGSHAYLDRAIFDTRYDHDWLLQQIQRKCVKVRLRPLSNIIAANIQTRSYRRSGW